MREGGEGGREGGREGRREGGRERWRKINTNPSRQRVTVVHSGRCSMLHTSCDSFKAAARTSRGDLRPILQHNHIRDMTITTISTQPQI